MREYGYGVDVGGTSVKIGRMDRRGRLLEKWSIPTDRSDGGSRLIGDVGASLAENMARAGLRADDLYGVGLDVPSPVDREGWVVGGENTGWGRKRLDAAGELSALLRVPVRALNDGNAAALGEMWKGAGAGCRDLVMLTVGTALGGGVIADGRVVTGSHGAGGEVGSMMMDPTETEIAVDGRGGCLEQYASATGLVRKAKKLLASDARPSVLRGLAEPTAKDVMEAARAGDDLACRTLDFFSEMLGRACSIMASVTDPELFVIGGGVSAAGEILLEGVRKYYRKYAYFALSQTRFELARLGNDAGIYGSCYFVLPEDAKKDLLG